MLDKYNRKINYLRVSVTDRCNLRCQYCMPENGIRLMKHQDILSFDEITEVVEAAARIHDTFTTHVALAHYLLRLEPKRLQTVRRRSRCR